MFIDMEKSTQLTLLKSVKKALSDIDADARKAFLGTTGQRNLAIIRNAKKALVLVNSIVEELKEDV